MNPEMAYEQHTALANAMGIPGSPTRGWLDAYHEGVGLNPLTGDKQDVVALGEPAPRRARWAKASVVVAFEPDTTPSTEPAGVIDPQALTAPPSAVQADGEELPDYFVLTRDVLGDMAAGALRSVTTTYITADMVDVIEQAAAALPDTEFMPFHPGHSSGFVVLGRPLRLPYGDGTEQVIDAFSWLTLPPTATAYGSGRPGMVWQYVNRRAHTERATTAARVWFPSQQAWDRAPDLLLNIADRYVTGTPIGGLAETEQEAEEVKRRLIADLTGRPSPEPVDTGRPQGRAVGRFQPLLAATLLLLNQDITATQTQAVSDFARRRATRARRAPHATEVTVVDLIRRTPTEHDDEHPTTGSHLKQRHLVSGHWRWVPYGPRGSLRRRVYVADYDRGPADQDLVIKPRVQRLGRGGH